MLWGCKRGALGMRMDGRSVCECVRVEEKQRMRQHGRTDRRTTIDGVDSSSGSLQQTRTTDAPRKAVK